MEWLLIVALAVWVFVQGRGLAALTSRLEILERRTSAAGIRVEAPAPADVAPPIAASLVEPQDISKVSPAPAAVPRGDKPRAGPWDVKAPPKIHKPLGPAALAWISEHGLAWLGGGALALGGLFLVAYAAQRGVFTPALRIMAAVAAGLVMIAASEWARRQLNVLDARQTPVAALLAGAGAATLYGAVWASDRLYGFIDLSVSAPLLALISAGLLGLAFIHGWPLAVAALFGAYLAPLVTNGPDWGDGPLTAYLILILLTGYAACALRRWPHAGLAATTGAVIWALANRADGAGLPAVLLLALSPAAAIAACFWRRARAPADAPSGLLLLATTVALLASIAASLAMWRGTTTLPIPAASLFAILAVLSAFAAAQRMVAAQVQIAAYVAPVLWLMAVELTGVREAEARQVAFSGLAMTTAVIASGLGAAALARTVFERSSAAAAAAAAAFLLALLTHELGEIHALLGWGAPALGAGVLALAAGWIGRRSEAPTSDLGLAIWIWSAMFVAGRALGAGVDTFALPAAMAALGLLAAFLQVRLRWRGFATASVATALTVLATLAFAVAPAVFGGQAVVWQAVASFAVAAGLLWGAGFVIRRGDDDADLADGLGMAAMIGALIGAFVLLRYWAQLSGGGADGLDRLTETALFTLLLLAAGLVSAKREETTTGRLARIRPHVFLLAGLAFGLLGPGLALNPLLSSFVLPIKGPPVFDALGLAYLVPAVLLVLATRRWVSSHRALLAAYAAGALLFAILWVGLEIRRLFQGSGLHAGLDTVGRAEAAAYGLAALVMARAMVAIACRAREQSWTISPIAPETTVLANGLSWGAFLFAAVVFGYAASPWWGPLTRPFTDVPAVFLLLGLYAVGAGAWLTFSFGEGVMARVARAATALQVFLLLSLAIRFAFRGLDMHPAVAEARMETWTFSAIWALYGVGVLILGARREDIVLRWTGLALLLATTAKVFLFDMARLDGMVRAGSFLALGALLIVAALAARRIGALGFGAAREEAEVAG